MTDQATLVTELEDIARSVPGVRQLYPAGSIAGTVLQEGARALGIGSGARLIRVKLTENRCEVTVSFAVTPDTRAGDVARDLAQALSAACVERGLPPAHVNATVAQVAST